MNTSGDEVTNSSHDVGAPFDTDSRILVLWVQIVIGSVGGLVVCSWLWCNRKRKSRVNVILLHVTLSDLLVMVATLIQVIWEMADREWMAGDAFCRIIKFYQSFSMLSSSNMMVLLSIDRHQAIRSPLRKSPAVWKMASPCWLMAALLSIPMFFMYRVRFDDNPESDFYNKTICESLLGDKPLVHRQVFLTSMSVIHVYIPCVIIAVCYVRMFSKIAEKANSTTSGSAGSSSGGGGGGGGGKGKPGQILLQSNRSSLPKAKIKTLKMTVVIVTTFIVCGLPYHILELIRSFWGPSYVSPLAEAIFGALPVANSVMNPYIFLLFTINPCSKNQQTDRHTNRRNGPEHSHICQSRTVHPGYKRDPLGGNLTQNLIKSSSSRPQGQTHTEPSQCIGYGTPLIITKNQAQQVKTLDSV